MNWLDMHTVMFSQVITDILGLIVIFFLWRQNRGRYRGISQWAVGFGLQALGTILIVTRGAVPEWISVPLGNALIVAGIMTTVEGVGRFVGRVRSRIPDFALLGVFVVVMYYFCQVRENLEARILAVSATYIIISFLGAVAGFRRSPSEKKRIAYRVGITFALFILANVIRIIAILARPLQSQNFFHSGEAEVLFLIAYQALFILMTYNFALMVNERLIGDVRFQEEKFAKAFRSSPYAIFLSDAESGRIMDVNDGFVNILGYAQGEAVGKTTLELKIWEHDEDRRRMLEILSSQEKIHEMEFRFRTKSGEMITGLWSAEQIMINNRPSIYASINNISIRKKALEDLHESVREKELLMKELKHRVKNSLMVVSSLLGLSREAATDPEVKTVLSDLRSRIGSVSSVYEQLDRTGQVDMVNLKSYIRNLADSLVQSYGPTDGRIRLTTTLANLSVKTKRALPLGLILNELIINGFKYAYPEGKSGEIRVELKLVTNGMCLTVSDDGVGRPAGVVSKGGGGTGTSLIETLADQIDARIMYPPGPGTTVVIIL